MRLLNVHTYKLHTFYGDAIPKYAILSHTWLAADEEVTFLHLQTQESTTWRQLPGAKKIFYTCQQARDDGHTWAWVDTCCIDKSSSTELSEAINSMYTWYQRAVVCYAYLSDVTIPLSIRTLNTEDVENTYQVIASKWWTRGWTLQELIAPQSVVFYVNGSDAWSRIGTRSSLVELVATRTGIAKEYLIGEDARRCSVAQRMSWASERITTRPKDMAYCLLGIFGVNMPLLYGEGSRAFIRLQVRSYNTCPIQWKHSLTCSRKKS